MLGVSRTNLESAGKRSVSWPWQQSNSIPWSSSPQLVVSTLNQGPYIYTNCTNVLVARVTLYVGTRFLHDLHTVNNVLLWEWIENLREVYLKQLTQEQIKIQKTISQNGSHISIKLQNEKLLSREIFLCTFILFTVEWLTL